MNLYRYIYSETGTFKNSFLWEC